MSAAVALQTLPKIEVSHLTVNYAEKNREFTALRDVNFTVEEGEFVSVIGASGCGKSTLLSVLEGLYKQADGSINISGKPVSGTGKERGKRHPTLGDGVMVGSGAKVLGNVTIGDRAKIGANAVVLWDVPADTTAVGMPARLVVHHRG